MCGAWPSLRVAGVEDGLLGDVEGGPLGDVEGGPLGDVEGGLLGDVEGGLLGDVENGPLGDVEGRLLGDGVLSRELSTLTMDTRWGPVWLRGVLRASEPLNPEDVSETSWFTLANRFLRRPRGLTDAFDGDDMPPRRCRWVLADVLRQTTVNAPRCVTRGVGRDV